MRAIAVLGQPDEQSMRLFEVLTDVCGEFLIDLQAINRADLADGGMPWLDLEAADLLIVDTDDSSSSMQVLGIAATSGTPTIHLSQKASPRRQRPDWRTITYAVSSPALRNLRASLRTALRRFRTSGSLGGVRGAPKVAPIELDLSILDQPRFEQLVFELLEQSGLRNVRWQPRDLFGSDLVATHTRRDPDGFSFDEEWDIVITSDDPRQALQEALHDLETRAVKAPQREHGNEARTLLLVCHQNTVDHRQLTALASAATRRRMPRRLRIWSDAELQDLLRKHPEVAIKYADQRSGPKSSRRSSEDIRQENLRLNQELRALLEDRQVEHESTLAVEVDTAWKEVAFQTAHKLGNPIFAVETAVKTLQLQLAAARLDKSTATAERILSIIEDAKGIISEFKSLNTASQLSLGSVDVGGLLVRAGQIAEPEGMRVTYEIDPLLPPVHGDHAKLGHALDELVRNSIHWSEGQPERRLDLSALQKGENIEIRLRDAGPGVPADAKDRIFLPFVTLSEAGSGLGLAIVRATILAHGGTIREVGEEGSGADFRIHIPVKT